MTVVYFYFIALKIFEKYMVNMFYKFLRIYSNALFVILHMKRDFFTNTVLLVLLDKHNLVFIGSVMDLFCIQNYFLR